MKITFLDASTVDAGDINLDCIREHGDLIIHSTTSNNETLQRVIDSEIIITNKVIIDCSHGNSGKVHSNQPIVLDAIMSQYDNSENIVAGVMIESNLKEGNQKLTNDCALEYGKSITDACVGLDVTTDMLQRMAKSWNNRHIKKRKTNDLPNGPEISTWSHDDFVNNIRC